MMKLLIINVTPTHTSHRVSDTITHVALNTINGVVVLTLAWTCVVPAHSTRTYDL